MSRDLEREGKRRQQRAALWRSLAQTTSSERESQKRLDELDLRTGFGVRQIVDKTADKVIDLASDFLGPTETAKNAIKTVASFFKGDGLRFRYHGNWGGPGYSAGKYYKSDEPLTAEDLKQSAVSKSDEAYKRHDIRYARAQTLGTKEQRIEALREADRRLIDDLRGLLRGMQLGLSESASALSALALFNEKLQYDAYSDPGLLNTRDAQAWNQLYTLALDEEVPLADDTETAEPLPSVALMSNDDDGPPVYAMVAEILEGPAPDNEEDARAELAEVEDLLRALDDGDPEEFN